jgi:lysophospholipase L1-like esterase
VDDAGMSLSFTSAKRLLFIGDSITDCDRHKDPEELGKGYVRLVRDYLLAKDPAGAPVVINTGVSGNKVPDLEKRWQRAVIDLKPDVLSIFIGINDVWHGLVPDREGTTIERYTTGLHDLLKLTRDAFPQIELVMCEPSVLWLSDPPNANELLGPYIAAIRNLARDFAANCVVPLHGAFENAKRQRPAVQWTTDGVHPTSIGHMLIARTWLEATGTL